jgi:hypothetical protein
MFIWERDDGEELMVRIAERIYEHEQEQGAFIETYLKTFFALKKDQIREDLIAKQDLFLRDR